MPKPVIFGLTELPGGEETAGFSLPISLDEVKRANEKFKSLKMQPAAFNVGTSSVEISVSNLDAYNCIALASQIIRSIDLLSEPPGNSEAIEITHAKLGIKPSNGFWQSFTGKRPPAVFNLPHITRKNSDTVKPGMSPKPLLPSGKNFERKKRQF
jgi:hypothetical protein